MRYWKHKKGGVYEIVGWTVLEDGWKPAVVYRRLDQPGTVTRACEVFFDGRFTPIEEPAPPAPIVVTVNAESLDKTILDTLRRKAAFATGGFVRSGRSPVVGEAGPKFVTEDLGRPEADFTPPGRRPRAEDDGA